MAAPGTFTAYRQLKPLQGDVSQDIQNQEELGFQRREEKRRVDNAEQLKLDKEAQKKQALWDKHVKPLSNYDTGSKSLNEIQGRLLLEAQKEYVPLMSVVNNPNASDEDRLKATLKLENINRLPENLMSMTKSLTERDLAVKKGIAEGRLFANPDYDKNYQEGFGNKLLALDENGMPMIAFKNPDGSTDLETYDQIQNVMKKYDFTQRFDRDKELLEASTKLQPEINQTDDGTQRVKTTAINPNLLSDYVSNQLFEADGVTPTPKLKSFAKDQGVAFTDTKGLKKIADDFTKDIRLRVKGGTEITRNYNNLDVQKEANDEAERRRQAAKDAKDEPVKELGAKNINQVGTVTGNTPKAGSVLKNINGAKAYSIEGSNLERAIGKKGAYERVNNIYVLPNKTLALEVDKVDGTVGGGTSGDPKTSNTQKVLYRSDENANEIGDFISKKINPKTGKYYKNIPEFMKDALGVKEEKSATKASSTTKSNKPKTVVQNGYTYTLNEATGNYE